MNWVAVLNFFWRNFYEFKSIAGFSEAVFLIIGGAYFGKKIQKFVITKVMMFRALESHIVNYNAWKMLQTE